MANWPSTLRYLPPSIVFEKMACFPFIWNLDIRRPRILILLKMTTQKTSYYLFKLHLNYFILFLLIHQVVLVGLALIEN